mmetsp:Transcript_29021/g.25665  ORF Transcript_29021/g.25665 Transcript_29021/m.25665 type:complete len:91 (+) Transcript_29021:276-548(+)
MLDARQVDTNMPRGNHQVNLVHLQANTLQHQVPAGQLPVVTNSENGEENKLKIIQDNKNLVKQESLKEPENMFIGGTIEIGVPANHEVDT